MLLKHALYTIAAVVGLTIGCALAIAGLRGDLSFESVLENTWLCSGVTAFIGYLFGSGARSGGDAWTEHAASSVSHDPARYREADNADARLGISFGFLVMITGLVLFGVSLGVLAVVF